MSLTDAPSPKLNHGCRGRSSYTDRTDFHRSTGSRGRDCRQGIAQLPSESVLICEICVPILCFEREVLLHADPLTHSVSGTARAVSLTTLGQMCQFRPREVSREEAMGSHSGCLVCRERLSAPCAVCLQFLRILRPARCGELRIPQRGLLLAAKLSCDLEMADRRRLLAMVARAVLSG